MALFRVERSFPFYCSRPKLTLLLGMLSHVGEWNSQSSRTMLYIITAVENNRFFVLFRIKAHIQCDVGHMNERWELLNKDKKGRGRNKNSVKVTVI